MRTTTSVRAARWVTMCVLASGLLLGAQATTFGGQAGAASSGGGVLTIGQDLSGTINPIIFDPSQFNAGSCCFSYDWPIYAGLLRETASGAYVPDLASNVTIPNSTTINIQVRPGLVYSNGTPLDAAAVKAGFERNLIQPELRGRELGFPGPLVHRRDGVRFPGSPLLVGRGQLVLPAAG